mmetsp:Transcript_81050/g.160621  ORF Transcript_81050/g.160621 Transcript_81050/m.160621 type:complete len:110 (-) Transcript_81050:4-333(-)
MALWQLKSRCHFFFAGVQVSRDSCVTEEEVQTPLLELKCRGQQVSDAGEFVPVNSADLVCCLRRTVCAGLVFFAGDRDRPRSQSPKTGSGGAGAAAPAAAAAAASACTV